MPLSTIKCWAAAAMLTSIIVAAACVLVARGKKGGVSPSNEEAKEVKERIMARTRKRK